jgi:hypothetical protein
MSDELTGGTYVRHICKPARSSSWCSKTSHIERRHHDRGRRTPERLAGTPRQWMPLLQGQGRLLPDEAA